MKISKNKGLVIAALIALTSISFTTSTATEYSGNFFIEESKTESLSPHGHKETVVRKDFGFNFNKNTDSDLVFTKESGEVK